ncbi:ATP-dependent DNA/RNA helicase dhx36 [Cichlidogyrus casuarinus]|uniref:ATP-dependent DNA/RNA helicase dhx36 n=1 Tax=Cichlidogyrus casuarinus TaxID=1844966 RepID=A0ABD2PUE5_9PLAT
MNIGASSINKVMKVLNETKHLDFSSEQNDAHVFESSEDAVREEMSEAGFLEQVSFSSRELTRDPNFDSLAKQRLEHVISSDQYRRLLELRQQLPAYQRKQDILQLIKENTITVISGATGSGKTTQIPQMVLESEINQGNASMTRIIVTQPRRISATSVAERVIQERGIDGHHVVGYQIRLKKRLPVDKTGCILFCTTGIILQSLRSDPLLKGISHIFVDEVHEREFLGDFLLTMLKRINRQREELGNLPPLKIVLMSATMNTEELSQYFGDCPIFEIPGRLHPVKAYFLEDAIKASNYRPDEETMRKLTRFVRGEKKRSPAEMSTSHKFGRWLQNTDLTMEQKNLMACLQKDDTRQIPMALVVALVEHINRTTTDGAILVFVTGMAEITELAKALRRQNPALYGEDMHSPVIICPLHSMINYDIQMKAFSKPKPGQRKLVIATNIAETSITIEDVLHVIDCGRIKITKYDPKTNCQLLTPVLVAQANALQRRGRAGRVRPGQCYHLFSSFEFENCLPDRLAPEILRIRLEEIILRIKVSCIQGRAIYPESLKIIAGNLSSLVIFIASR